MFTRSGSVATQNTVSATSPGGERVGARVHLGGARVVAVKANVRELGAADHSGLDDGDAHARAGQVGAQVERELVHERLGGAVDVRPRVRPAGGGRAQVHDVPAVARHHAGQHGARHGHQALAVGVDHLVPVVERRLVRRLEPQRQAGVVDQQIDRREIGRQPGDRLRHGRAVAHVERQDEQPLVAELGAQRFQPIDAPTRGDDAMPGAREPSRDLRAEPRRRSRDQNDHGREYRAIPSPSPREAGRGSGRGVRRPATRRRRAGRPRVRAASRAAATSGS